MTKLKSITTIELSSKCNLNCSYCINRFLVKFPLRKAEIMHNLVFDASLNLLKRLVERGTQEEVNLNGNGESFLDPQLVQRVKRVKDIVPNQIVMLCTNGTLITNSLARNLKEAGIDRIDVSLHNIVAARKAVSILMQNGIPGVVNLGLVTNPHNWAGQLEKENCVDILPSIDCHPLIDGKGYIQSDGRIVPCCYDYRNLGAFASVYSDNILDIEYGSFELCQTCHQKLPEN